MSELFIELLSEEIPYWLQKNTVEQFKNKITDVIIENNLSLSKKNNIQFKEDDWESPTLGASGLGWEIRCKGTEICQYTYFQQI